MWGKEEEKKPNRGSKGSFFVITWEEYGPPVIHKRVLTERALQLMDLCNAKYPFTYRNLDNGGIYSGAGGLAFAMFHLSRCGAFKDELEVLKSNSLQLADLAIQYCKRRSDSEDVVSFFYGKGGIYAVCAAIYRTNGKESKAQDCLERFVHGQWHCKDVNYSATGGDDLANGRAGYISGVLWLSKYFNPNEIRLYTLYDLLRVVVESVKQNVDQPYIKSRYGQVFSTFTEVSPFLCLNLGSAYLGMLMGLAGILRVFLLCPFYLDEQKPLEKEVRQAVDFLLGLQKEDGTYPDKLEDIDCKKMSYEKYAQWKTGTGGICSLMAAAYMRWKDERYLNSCIKSCEFAWKGGLYKSKFGLGNGTAGTCYLFLMMYRLTNDDKYLHQALLFAEFLVSEKHLNLVNKNSKNITDFSLMEGLAGIAVLITDILNPSEADFPLLPVFSKLTRIY